MTLIYRVLQVEDNIGDTVLLKRAIARHNLPIELQAVQSGEAAMEQLSARVINQLPPSEKIRVVLLDLNLPGMSGAEVLREITAQPQLDDLKVAFLTSAEDTAGYDVSGIDHRISTHFTKPETLSGYGSICAGLMILLQGC